MLANLKVKIPTYSIVQVPNTGILVLAANDRRFYAFIQNNSTVDIWLMYGQQGAAGDGIMIPKGGFSWEIDRLNLWQGDVYAIHAGAGNRQMNVLDCW